MAQEGKLIHCFNNNASTTLDILKLTLRNIQSRYHRHIETITTLQQRIHSEERQLKACLQEERELRDQLKDQREPVPS